jgi:hypothetical protein
MSRTIRLLLHSGREIYVNAFLVEQTGSRIHAPFAEPTIADRFASAALGIRDAARRLNDALPCVFVDEWVKTFVPPSGRHGPPKWMYVAWLGSTRVDGDDDGSELLLGWFADGVLDISTALADAIGSLDWERQAQGFSF